MLDFVRQVAKLVSLVEVSNSLLVEQRDEPVALDVRLDSKTMMERVITAVIFRLSAFPVVVDILVVFDFIACD